MFVLVLAVGLAPAPAAGDSTVGTQVWLRYQYQRRLSEGLRGFGMLRYEERLDSENLFGAWTRLATTGGVSYDVGERFRIQGGLGLYYTFNPDVQDVFEFRFWQAGTFDWPNSSGKVRRYVLHHRLMFEERFKYTDDWDLDPRLRYRLAFSFPITRYTVQPGALYAPLGAEIFVTSEETELEVYIERWRFIAGLGYVINQTWSVEARYTAQLSRSAAGADLQATDHVVDVRFKTAVRIRDLLKIR